MIIKECRYHGAFTGDECRICEDDKLTDEILACVSDCVVTVKPPKNKPKAPKAAKADKAGLITQTGDRYALHDDLGGCIEASKQETLENILLSRQSLASKAKEARFLGYPQNLVEN